MIWHCHDKYLHSYTNLNVDTDFLAFLEDLTMPTTHNLYVFNLDNMQIKI